MSGSQATRAVPELDESQVMLDEVTLELLNSYEYLAAIHDSASDLTMTGSMRDAARTTLAAALDVTGSSGGVMILHVNGADETVASVNANRSVEDFALARYRKNPEAERYEDAVRQRIAAGDGAFLESCFSIPLRYRERAEGILFLFSTKSREYTSVDLKIARVLAGQGVLSMRNLVTLEELERKNTSLSDTLAALTTAQDELVRAERFSALGEMSSMIVHDIKKPMASLHGYAQLLSSLADTIDPARIREYANLIVTEMGRLSRMTEEIMDFSRGTSSQLSLREMRPAELINSVWPILESDLEGHGMTLERGDIANEIPVRVDSDKMARVFINLAVNARQAMEAGGALSLSVRNGKGCAEFSFSDGGSGIPAELRETIFEPFVTGKRGQSLGIGLAMSQWIVQAHGGGLRVARTGPEGTEMVVRIPVAEESQ